MGMRNSKIKKDFENYKHLTECTAFTEKELEKWYIGFIKDCPSGKMTKTEFEQMYKNFFKDGDASRYEMSMR